MRDAHYGREYRKLLATVLQQLLLLARLPRPRIGIPIPTYTVYSGKQSANAFRLARRRYELARDLNEVLGRIVPVALVDHAARWYQLVGHTAGTMADIHRLLREEILPYDYRQRMRQELELRTHDLGKSLTEFV